MSRSLWFLFFLLFAVAIFSLMAGPASVSFQDYLNFFSVRGSQNEDIAFLIGQIRIPRTIACLFVGGALGVCGLVLQTVLRNPLAEPYTLGLSGGSSFGAIVAIHLALTPELVWLPVLSTIGCLLALGIVLWVAHNQFFETRSFILAGVMVSLFFGATVVTGLSFVRPDQLQTVLFWLMGEFGTYRDTWALPFLPVFLTLFIWIFISAPKLDLLALGETRAYSLGLSPRKEQVRFVIVCTLLTSLCVSIAGLVGFIGLVAPHLARKILRTSNHRYLFLGATLIGAELLTVADCLARGLLGGVIIPAGSIAALVGAPTLLLLLRSPQLRGQA